MNQVPILSSSSSLLRTGNKGGGKEPFTPQSKTSSVLNFYTILISSVALGIMGGMISWSTPIWFRTSVIARALVLSLVAMLGLDWKNLKPKYVLLIVVMALIGVYTMDKFFPPKLTADVRYHHTLLEKSPFVDTFKKTEEILQQDEKNKKISSIPQDVERLFKRVEQLERQLANRI